MSPTITLLDLDLHDMNPQTTDLRSRPALQVHNSRHICTQKKINKKILQNFRNSSVVSITTWNCVIDTSLKNENDQIPQVYIRF